MTNGQMLDELRRLAAEEKTVPTKVYLRMFSAAMAEMMNNQGKIEGSVNALEESMNKKIEVIEEAIGSNSKCVDAVQDQVMELRKQYMENGLSKNPMVILGAHIKRNPKLFSTLMVLLVILANVWFISGFRRAVLLMLHVPIEVVNMLAP